MKDKLRIEIYKARIETECEVAEGYLGVIRRKPYTNDYEVVLSDTMEGLPAAVESGERYVLTREQLEEIVGGDVSLPLGRLVYQCRESVKSI